VIYEFTIICDNLHPSFTTPMGGRRVDSENCMALTFEQLGASEVTVVKLFHELLEDCNCRVRRVKMFKLTPHPATKAQPAFFTSSHEVLDHAVQNLLERRIDRKAEAFQINVETVEVPINDFYKLFDNYVRYDDDEDEDEDEDQERERWIASADEDEEDE